LAADRRSGCAAQIPADFPVRHLEDRSIGEALCSPNTTTKESALICERSSARISGQLQYAGRVQRPNCSALNPLVEGTIVGTQAGERALLATMLAALAIFYRGSDQLPITALGLALFALCALLRPDLALRFVPLAVPLFFIPKGIWDARFGIRDTGVKIPLHEVVLLVTAGATALHWLLRRRAKGDEAQANVASGDGRLSPFALRPSPFAFLLRLSPFAFLLAGTAALLVAWGGDRGAALREWRWLIVEPLLFYALLRYWLPRRAAAGQGPAAFILQPFLLGGAIVGLLGALQLAGVNLVPLLGTKAGFSDDSILAEGVQRTTSVYGHPNNLGLYMDRIWPPALALGVGLLGARRPGGRIGFYLGCAALGALGVLASFSKGALLGGLVALPLLAALTAGPRWARRALLAATAAALVLGGVAGLALGVERLNPLGETSGIRLSTWGSALRMALDHPLLGVGLDQFGRLYPQYIDPALANTNEINTAHPHNLVLDIWLRMGLLGLAAFGLLLAHLFRLLRPHLRPAGSAPLALGTAAALVAALAHGLVDSFYFWPDLAFALWMFVALAEERLDPSQKEMGEPGSPTPARP
jgi:O-antigen ligase